MRFKNVISIPLLVLCMFLMGQDKCEEGSPPPDTDKFCAGSELSVRKINRLSEKLMSKPVIKHGEPSTDRRGTVIVSIPSGGYCSGVVMSPSTVLTAAHCGWSEVGHLIKLDYGTPPVGVGVGSMEHPEYRKYASSGDQVAREYDVMLIVVDEELPPPYVDLYQYEMEAPYCVDILAQGFGVTEQPLEIPCTNGASRCLREGSLSVDAVNVAYDGSPGRLLKTGHRGVTKICFGDSGSALYAITPNGPKIAGITSTTSSSDCEAGSHHVHTGHPEIKTWIYKNLVW